MTRILGVMDEDPFDYRTWSGSSKYLFSALKEHQVLAAAISAEPSRFSQRIAQLTTFQPDMEKWKFSYHLSTRLFGAMTSAAKRKIAEYGTDFDTILQVGAWYDLIDSSVVNVSYHDGNLATRLSSPFGFPAVTRSIIDRALAYERHLYQRMDIIFPMSEWLRQSFIKDFGVAEDKVKAVGAGINLPAIRNTENRSYGSKRILMVGKDFNRKGGKHLLAAFKKVKQAVPEAELRIIGPDLGDVAEGVKCLGFVSKNDATGLEMILDEYTQADVFTVPSLYEPFGISFCEAMAHRVPCVGTNICAMPEIIREGITGFVVPPGESEPLANRLIELLRSETLCQQMGEAGYQHYRENYTWEIVTQKIIQNINSIM